MCKFNPFTSTNSAKEAVRLLVKYIPKGVLVGCSDLINQPSLICNNLVDSLIELLKITELYELAINCIYELEEFNQNEQYQILIVKILILQGEQLKAVRIMYDYLKSYPRDGLMLNEQAKYLLSKNRSDLALIPSKRAVESLPGEFECWSTLVECYIMLKDYSNALLSLNSCPMYSTKKKDIFKAIKPGDFSFPFPAEGSYTKIWQDAEDIGCMSGLGGIVEFSPLVQVENVNPIYLQVYNSVKLHSTFKKAYDFLSIIARQKGWSELLRLRSNVFVMEDEYHSLILNEQKQEQKEHLEYLKSSSQLQLNQQQTGSSNNTSNTSNTNHLTVDSINGSNADFNNGNGNVYDSTTTSNIENGGEFIRGRSSSLSFVKKRRNSSQVSKFRSKRLSERWLDSLFLIFYEELRSVLMYEMENNNSSGSSNGGGNGRRRSERSGDSVENDGNGAVSQEVTQHIALEWELIGAACFRAHHYDSGIEAYKTCLEGRFSLFASTQLLRYYLNLKESPVEFIRLNPSVVNRPNSFIKNDYILNLLVKHLAWNYRWYGEFSVLSIKVLKILLEEEGGSFIQTTVGVIFENEGITSVVDKLINWIEQFDNNV
ncbi:unnamed protein product [[Candida] boidinii]|nr:unnamed protein product [[Candida] boidinii]